MVSIIIPVYNCEKFIEECIQSVLNQTFKDWELILIDDFSSDSSRNIINEYITLDPRVKAYYFDENVGAGITRNKGIEISKGRFIAFLDSDDYWHKDKLRIQIDFMIHVALKFLSSVLKKRAIVFMLSDFMDDNYEKTLKIAGSKHDLTGIRVYDKHDEEIPNLGMVPILDSETGKVQLINTSAKSVRTSYKGNASHLYNYYLNVFKRSGSGTVNTRVDEDYVKKLLGYFKHKGK